MLLEAMAAFLPVIAISATGVSDVVENGRNGILSTDSTEEWGRNLVYVMENRNVLTGMKMEARKTALRYNEKIIAANFKLLSSSAKESSSGTMAL